jgi:excisionase family DNA binding protein
MTPNRDASREATPVRSPLFSIPEAAEYLKLGVATIYEKLGTELQAVKIGRRRFVTRDSCDNLILRSTQAMTRPRARRAA